ncbi:site-specific recombinase, phage integrase family [Oesophagostomum dentatum]|uniref:Site-specific recombinase, phage integrase family n=1 Tax=Oesophagostomum dentatum TaxID=61180 RepID=A0A0B1SRP2_OESDE|nr:site-specific recombinase, phage integrase family [Oesophagostomum dentatum]
MPSVNPRQSSGLGIIAGAKWWSWADTIASARRAGREELAQVVGASANSSLASGTMNAYSSMRQRFSEFTSSFNDVNANLGKYRNLFIAHLMHMGQLKSIPLAVASLNFFYGRLVDGDAELQKLLTDSAKRETPPAVHRKKASQEDIDAVVQSALQQNTKTAITEASIILLLFLAFLRISEVASVRRKHLEHKGQDTWWLRVPKSKTDQQGIGATIAFKVDGLRKVLWDKFMEIVSGKDKEQHLFATPTGNGPSTDELRKRINAVLKTSGLGQKGLTSHSFRGGAATHALRKGVSQEDIKRTRRERSLAPDLITQII